MSDEKTRKKSAEKNSNDACEKAGGPAREAGGTTGAANVSEASASRTGGATSGMPHASSAVPTNKIPPDA